MTNRWDCYFGGVPSRKTQRRWWYEEVAEAERRLKFRAQAEEVRTALRDKRAEREAKQPVNLRASQGYILAYQPVPRKWDAPSHTISPNVSSRLQLAGTDRDLDVNIGERSARKRLRLFLNDPKLIHLGAEIDCSGTMNSKRTGKQTEFTARMRALMEERPDDAGSVFVESPAESPAPSICSDQREDAADGGKHVRFDSPIATTRDTNGDMMQLQHGFDLAKRDAEVQTFMTTALTYRNRTCSHTFDDRLMANSWQEAVGGVWPDEDKDNYEDDPNAESAGDRQEGDDAIEDEDDLSDTMTIRGKSVKLASTPDPAEGIAEYYERRARSFGLDPGAGERFAMTL